MDNNYWDNSLVTVCDSEPKLLGALIADGLVELFTVVDGSVIERNGAESSVFGSAGALDRRIRSGEGFSPIGIVIATIESSKFPLAFD